MTGTKEASKKEEQIIKFFLFSLTTLITLLQEILTLIYGNFSFMLTLRVSLFLFEQNKSFLHKGFRVDNLKEGVGVHDHSHIR
ncbi:hypothetical protein JCM12298_00090 [Desulfothermus naphthae]